MPKSHWSWVAGFLWVACWASSAGAQEPCLESTEDELGLSCVSVELAVTESSLARDNIGVTSLSVLGGLRIDRRWELWLRAGGVLLLNEGAGGDWTPVAASANPWVGASYRLSSTPQRTVRVHAGATAPLAYPGSDAQAGLRRAALAWAAGMHGLWDAWLWAPEQMGASAGAVVELRPAAKLAFRLRADVAGTFSIGTATSDSGDLYGQWAAEWELALGLARIGAGLQAVFVTSDSDMSQWAVTPQLALAWPEVLLRVRWLVNLDEPLGYQGAGMDVWALRFGAEVRL